MHIREIRWPERDLARLLIRVASFTAWGRNTGPTENNQFVFTVQFFHFLVSVETK
jgi:hypothetical protein